MLTYEEWLSAIFDHPTTRWYFNYDLFEPENWRLELWELEKNPKTVVEYVTRTFQECAALSQTFTDEQIADGITYIINNSCSNLSFAIYDPENGVPLQSRLNCLKAVYTVYKELFAPRCSPDLGHTIYDNRVINPLNDPCYMWWDVTPLHGHPNDPRYAEIDQTVLQVMGKILTIDSAVCCEGALHGLGHWSIYYRKEVSEIIDSFLSKKRAVVRAVQGYAKAAKRGQVM